MITRFSVPDEELPGGQSLARDLLDRVMEFTDSEVADALADLRRRFTHRHRDLDAVFERHFDLAAPGMDASDLPSKARRLLIGAHFTAEYATEGAALTNPSMVEHPNQDGLAPGELRFVMSARAIGVGHVSCVAFRTGVVNRDGDIRVETPGPFLGTGQQVPTSFDHQTFRAQLDRVGADDDTAKIILDQLSDPFNMPALHAAVAGLDSRFGRDPVPRETIHRLESVALNHYGVTFPAESRIDERLLAPCGPSESQGLEDARFTRLVDDNGAVTYCATYTAYDGRNVAAQLIETEDFSTFRISQLSGPAAANTEMALFPRKVSGHYLSLSRHDRVRSSLTRSTDRYSWDESFTLDTILHPWEVIHAGNCGPPIETEHGWLVFTHGIGAMRTYGLGAFLLDLNDPYKVIGSTDQPLLMADPDERDGYVPNVIYSCGGMRHGDLIVLPYGYSDERISFAVIDLPPLLELLH